MAVAWAMSSTMNGFRFHSKGCDTNSMTANQAHLLSPSQRLLAHHVQHGFREQHAQHSAHGTSARCRQRLMHRAFRSSTVCTAVAGELRGRVLQYICHQTVQIRDVPDVPRY